MKILKKVVAAAKKKRKKKTSEALPIPRLYGQEYTNFYQRYTNINPIQSTQVKIKINKSPVMINANFINPTTAISTSSNAKYIAAMCPTETKISQTQFWEMVKQRKVKIIVKLTKNSEGSKSKCYDYWDDMDMITEPLRVYLNTDVDKINILLLQTREVCIYEYSAWPDHTNGYNVDSMAEMIKDIKKINKKNAPILVHCSAGIGRTSKFIVMDYLCNLPGAQKYIYMSNKKMTDKNGKKYNTSLLEINKLKENIANQRSESVIYSWEKDLRQTNKLVTCIKKIQEVVKEEESLK